MWDFCAKGRSKLEACRRRLGMFAVVPCGDRMRESIGVSLPGYSGSRHSRSGRNGASFSGNIASKMNMYST